MPLETNGTTAPSVSICELGITAQADRFGFDEASRTAEYPGWVRKLALGVFVASISYYAITLLWWSARSKHYLIRKRGSLFMILTTSGLILSEIGVVYRVYAGVTTYSCDLYAWRLAGIPLIVGPTVVRLVLHANGAYFSEMLLERGKEDVALEEYNDMTICNAFRVFLISFGGLCLRKRRRQRAGSRVAELARRESIGSQAIDSEFDEDDTDDIDEDCQLGRHPYAERDAPRRKDKSGQPSVVADTSFSVDIEQGAAAHPSEQSSRQRQLRAPPFGRGKKFSLHSLTADEMQLLVAYFKTTNVYGLGLLALFTAAIAGYIVYKSAKADSPYGGKGCTGCFGEQLDGYVLGSTLVGLLAVGFFLLWNIKGDEDVLGVVAELRISLVLALFATVALGIATIDPGSVQRRRQFPLGMLVLIIFMAIHFVQCPMQVYRTRCPLLNWLANCKVENPAPPPASGGLRQAVSFPRTKSLPRLLRDSSCSGRHASHGVSTPAARSSVPVASPSLMQAASTSQGQIEASRGIPGKPSLEEVLDSPEGRQAFVRQLSREHSIESYYLIDAVQRYRIMQTQHPSSPLVLDTAFKIFRTFIADNSILQVNVSWHASRELAKRVAALKGPNAEPPSADLFDEVRIEVIEMLRKDCFQRFLMSDLCKDFMRDRQRRLRQAITA